MTDVSSRLLTCYAPEQYPLGCLVNLALTLHFVSTKHALYSNHFVHTQTQVPGRWRSHVLALAWQGPRASHRACVSPCALPPFHSSSGTKIVAPEMPKPLRRTMHVSTRQIGHERRVRSSSFAERLRLEPYLPRAACTAVRRHVRHQAICPQARPSSVASRSRHTTQTPRLVAQADWPSARMQSCSSRMKLCGAQLSAAAAPRSGIAQLASRCVALSGSCS